MNARATRAVLRALKGEARFVGGCVRDTLLKRPIGDIDIATPLPPREVMRRLVAARIKAVPTGVAHGTVTAVVEGQPFEITTLRRDVETFGRRARVTFTANWEEDSRRRDFTMNALFLAVDGEVFDYHGGLRDLRRGKVRFVGDPETRIREDVLRLFRFYRFHAWYGRGAADRAARAACRALTPLVPTLSGERVQAETMKLLRAPDPLSSVALMTKDGVLAQIVPAARPLQALRRLLRIEPEPDPLRRLAVLVADGAGELAARLKFSKADRERLLRIIEPVDLRADARAEQRELYRYGRAAYLDRVLVTAAVTGGTRNVATLWTRAARWKPIAFPLKGRDVTKEGVMPGPEVGRLLAEIEAWWVEGDFHADRSACLAALRRRIGASHALHG